MNKLKVCHLIACTSAIGLGCASLPAAAFDIVFPAGEACDFALGIDVSGGDKTIYREFTDKNGNVVRTLTAGKGSDLVFTNVETNATFATKGNGFVNRITVNADGTLTEVTTGHSIIILFPTDAPPGPSTKLYVGRVVITIDPQNNYTLQSVSGDTTDICAALSG